MTIYSDIPVPFRPRIPCSISSRGFCRVSPRLLLKYTRDFSLVILSLKVYVNRSYKISIFELSLQVQI